MAEPAYSRHAISDRVWEMLESSLPVYKGTWGVTMEDDRLFIIAVFWILRTGASCRDRLT